MKKKIRVKLNLFRIFWCFLVTTVYPILKHDGYVPWRHQTSATWRYLIKTQLVSCTEHTDFIGSTTVSRSIRHRLLYIWNVFPPICCRSHCIKHCRIRSRCSSLSYDVADILTTVSLTERDLPDLLSSCIAPLPSRKRLCQSQAILLLHFIACSDLHMNFQVSVGDILATTQNLIKLRYCVLSSDVNFSGTTFCRYSVLKWRRNLTRDVPMHCESYVNVFWRAPWSWPYISIATDYARDFKLKIINWTQTNLNQINLSTNLICFQYIHWGINIAKFSDCSLFHWRFGHRPLSKSLKCQKLHF